MATDPIDRISVEIETSSTVAENGVSALVRSLESLNSVLNKIADTDAAKALKNVGKTAQKASAETSVQAKQSVLTRATRTVRESPAAKQQEQIRQSVRYSRVPNSAAQKEWAQIVRYLQGNGEKPDLDQKINLSELKKSIKESEKIEIDMMKKLDGFYDKFKSIQGENIIGKNAESALGDAEQKLTQLRDSINETRDAAASLDDILKKIENGNGQDIKQSDINGLIEQYRMAGSAARSAGIEADNAMKTAKDAIAQAQAKADEMRESLFANRTIWSAIKSAASNALEDVKTKLAEAASQSKLLAGAIKLGVPIIGTLGSILGSVLRGGLTLLGKLWSGFKRLASTIAGAVVGGLQKLGSMLKTVGGSVLNYVTKPFQRAISVIQKWKKTLGRLVFLRVVRSAIKEVTDGFKEGIENLYYFSSLTESQFKPAMDALASSSLYLKNSLGAMAAPLIQAVAPAVTYLIDLFVSLLNVVNMLFSVLSGRTYTKAMKTSAKYADDLDKSLGGGAASAKELQRYLIGIDQLTIMPDEPNKGGGGGGGSDLGAQYDEMFEEVPLPDWVLNIKDAIDQGDWYGAGELLAEKINSVIAGVDFEELGRKLGGVIQNAISFALGFIREMDWIAIGVDFASFLNGLFDSIDPNDLGALIASKIKIAFDLAYGFVTEFKWEEFGTWLGDVINGWVNEIDVDTVAGAISGAITGALELVESLLTEVDFESLGAKIGELLAGLDWGGIFNSALSAGGAFLNGLLGAISGILDGLGIDLDLSVNDAKVTDGGTINKDGLLTGIAGVLTAVAAGSILFKKSGLAMTALIATAAVGFTGNLVNSLFNKDGSFSSEEMVGSLVDGLNIVAGALLGFMVGGPKGAVIGAIISTGIMGEVNSMIFDKDGKLSTAELQNSLEYLFTTLGLAVTGWIIGGPIGSIVGLSLGVILEFAILSSKWKENQRLGNYLGPAGNMPAWELDVAKKEYEESVNSGETRLGEFTANRIAEIQEEYWSKYGVDSDVFRQTIESPKAELDFLSLGSMQTNKIDLLLDAKTTNDFDTATGRYMGVKNKRSRIDISARNRTPSVFRDATTAWDKLKTKNVTLSAMARNVNESVLSGLTSIWSGLNNKTATMTGVGVQTESLISLKSSYDGFKNKDAIVTTKGTQDKSIETVKNCFNSVNSKVATLSAYAENKNPTVLSSLKDAWNIIKNKSVLLSAKVAAAFSGAFATAAGKATGGIFAGGVWHDIAGYAGGGSPKRARLFYANENGMPELIGSIGGNTAVMNNGQIVASVSSGVYHAVSAAMGGLGNYFANIATGMSRIPELLSNIAPAHPQPVLVGAGGPAYNMDVSAVGTQGYDGSFQRDKEGNEEIINAIYAIGQRIISSIKEKDTNLYFDTQRVGSSTTEVQNRQTLMYGKTRSNG